ncbi:hypothetical protein [Pseudophaeobacter sp.]|uniref:hypothetical protein n=1 Tax=Pseudophaeobacter sp. TaxID=1971739 RepID=UPI003A9844B4
MAERITVPEINKNNIPAFEDEPSDKIIDDIREHINKTSSPHTWWGHSHTKPEQGAFVVYIEEFDVPASPKVLRVAPCPCCNPYHPQYKHKGKIAWFPNEAVIRLIGPDCFAALNAAGHEEALIALRKRRKEREELEIIRLHSPHLATMVEIIDAASQIADGLDSLRRRLRSVLEGELELNLWREVKDGSLQLSENTRVPFTRADGTTGERVEEIRTEYARVVGVEMLSPYTYVPSEKLMAFRASYLRFAARLREVVDLRDLEPDERQKMSSALTKGRNELAQILDTLRGRQRFLTSGAIDILGAWGEHPNAPRKFNLRRVRNEITASSPGNSRAKPSALRAIVTDEAVMPVPNLPELRSTG